MTDAPRGAPVDDRIEMQRGQRFSTRSGPSDQPALPAVVDLDVGTLRERPMRPDELPEVRRIWWRQVRLGNRMAAEPGVILLDGGLRDDWPAPRTGDPQAEAGKPGGGR